LLADFYLGFDQPTPLGMQHRRMTNLLFQGQLQLARSGHALCSDSFEMHAFYLMLQFIE
jgi:hypothetical protein